MGRRVIILKNALAPLLCFWVVMGCEPWTDDITTPKEALKLIKPHIKELGLALKYEDEEKIHAAAQKIQAGLGKWAGMPEDKPRYYKPKSDKSQYTGEDALKFYGLYFDFIEKRAHQGQGVYRPGGYPKDTPPMVRNTGYLVSGYSEILKHDLKIKDKIRKRLIQGADYLVRIQLNSGMFPFPDLRGKIGNFGPALERFHKRNPKAFKGQWVIEDDGAGGTQFNTGVNGVALIDAYMVTQNKRHLNAAKKAADYCKAFPMVYNWNYNSFSIWLLARYYAITKEAEYLDSAVKKCRLGLLPGLMESGRWSDPHNAKQCYHIIMVRSLLELWNVLPKAHGFRNQLEHALDISLGNLQGEIIEHGCSSINAAAQLIRAQDVFKRNKKRELAINILINAIFEKSGFGAKRFKPNGDEALPMARIAGYLSAPKIKKKEKMMRNDQKVVPWNYQAKCSHCSVMSIFDWNTARKSQDMGYDMTCPACNRLFNFTKWQYVSICPGCSDPFEVTMHSITIDNFGHQYKCEKCNGLISCSKDKPPRYVDLSNAIVIPFDAGKKSK